MPDTTDAALVEIADGRAAPVRMADQLSTAMLALFHFRDRWLLYRTLQDQLLAAGWALINRPAPTAADWAAFVKATESAVARYNAAYDSEVIPATAPQGSLNAVGGGVDGGVNPPDPSPDGSGPVRVE